MKKIIFPVTLFLVIFMSACSNASSGTKEVTPDDVVAAFQDAGLEAENPTEMTKDDYGVGPMKSKEGVRVTVPQVCSDCNARIISYENEADLDEMKEYYDSMGEESAMLFSWTAKHKNILIQVNGDMEEEEFNKYKKALESL